MISFDISAIDIILAMSVAILTILYLRKIQESFPDELSYRSLIKNVKRQDSGFDFETVYPKNLNNFESLDDDVFVSEESL